MSILFFILYDSILNTVFKGQVLLPLLSQLKNNKTLKITLVTFEKAHPKIKIEYHPRLTIIYFKKRSYLGPIQFLFGSLQLKKILQNQKKYHLIARGQIAGIISYYALTQHCYNFTVQIRGLLSEEYSYLETIRWYHFFKKVKYYYYQFLEKWMYLKIKPDNFNVVSPALKKHLIKRYNIKPEVIKIETADIVDKIPDHKKKFFRNKIRNQYHFNNQKKIYIYTGSTHAWQCIEQTIFYFKNQLKQEPESFLFLLVNKKKEILPLIDKYQLAPFNYALLTVEHSEVYQYLCASDFGIIFREKHGINWTARPTKALEYWSAGLKIVHNKTVDFINNINLYLNQ